MRRTALAFVGVSFAVLGSSLGGVAVGASRPSPKAAVAQAKTEWLKEVRFAARSGDRARDFPSPSRAVLVNRLERARRLYGFQVVGVTMLRPLQLAPVIVIQSDRKLALARAVPTIIQIFNPRHVTRRNPSGYAYEAYFLVAQDRHGVPYLATFNFMRAPRIGGGQWAASERLYPFPHG
jgi:hypothetical protein